MQIDEFSLTNSVYINGFYTDFLSYSPIYLTYSQ